MSGAVPESINESVCVSVPLLVRLNRPASLLSLSSGRVLARQSGDFQSPFKGRGMEFDESRLYQAGDDIRSINWKITARTGKPHTKLFREERERPMFVWVDLRTPMFFATRGRYKSVIAARLAGLVAWSAHHHGDRVGGVIFSDQSHHELKPRRGKSSVLRLINHIARHPAWQAENREGEDKRSGAKALIRLRRVVRPGSMVFLLSDFRNLDDGAWSQISRLSRHNEVVLIFIYDRLESMLPAPGRYRVSNGTDEVLLDTHDQHWSESYHQRFIDHHNRLDNLARANGIHLMSCSTEEDPVAVLQTRFAR
jgi:uncharacterized protein (DUF58 family)